MTTPKPKKKRRPLAWATIAQLVCMAERKNGEKLGIALTADPSVPDRWMLLAFSTPAPTGDIDGILDEHAHKTYPPVRGIREAMDAAERIANEWRRAGNRLLAEACPCEEIGKEAAAE